MSSEQQEQKQQQQQQKTTVEDLSLSSTSSSLSLIKLDELSSFGATKQNRLPTLIKLNNSSSESKDQLSIHQLRPKQANSMPVYSADQLEQDMSSNAKQQVNSLPVNLESSSAITTRDHRASMNEEDLENPYNVVVDKQQQQQQQNDKENQPQRDEGEEEDFQLVDMVGPSLPQPEKLSSSKEEEEIAKTNAKIAPFLAASSTFPVAAAAVATAIGGVQHHPLNASQQLLSHPGNIGDSLIEMVINLRNENQNLVRALEANNDYVKERINEFKRAQEESKKREAQFALEKADHEHQSRKLIRQNTVLSERLKSLETKLNSMKLEVNESLDAARSSKASSNGGGSDDQQLYPNLGDGESFQATTMQIDGTNQELLNNNNQNQEQEQQPMGSRTPTAPAMETEPTTTAIGVANMSKEELSQRFDANKAEFYALSDDPMKQCDRLEKQLNDIGKRDYEICLLQQQLNIYRQDFRLERMEKLEAKIQIEKLKNDIDRLCLERLNEQRSSSSAAAAAAATAAKTTDYHHLNRGLHHRRSGGVRFDPAIAADAVFNKLGHHISKKAAKSAAKAAKFASKQAHREEKIVAAAAAASAAANMAANSAAAGSSPTGDQQADIGHHHHHHRRHHSGGRHHSGASGPGGHQRGSGIRSEVVNDLLSTANKAMLTGYKMASTHVNLALDKLSQYEQQQAANLAVNKAPTSTNTAASAPIHHPSLD